MMFDSGQLYVKFSLYIWSNLFFVIVPVFCIFSVALKSKLQHRKIFNLNPSEGQYGREFIISLRTFFIYQLAFTGIWILYHQGLTSLYSPFAKSGYLYILPAFLLIHISHDAYFYFTHRWMHALPVLQKWHSTHHSSLVPTALTGNLFSVQEAVINALFYVLAAVVIPMPIHLLMFFFFFANGIDAFRHLEFEFLPDCLYRLPYAYILNSMTHHNYHHYDGSGNFGLFYRTWDEWFHTLNPDTHNQFYKTREKINAFFNRNYIPWQFRANCNDTVGQCLEVGFDVGENIQIFYEMNGECMPYYHSFTDGLGGLLRNFKEKNITLTSVPKIRNIKYSFLEKLQVFIFSIGSRFRNRTQWTGYKRNKKSKKEILYKAFLTSEELEIARIKAKKNNATLNTLFIHEFNNVLKKYVVSPAKFTWLVPVSKRKEISYGMDWRNDVWYVDLAVKENSIIGLHRILTPLYGEIDIFGGLLLNFFNYPFKCFLYPILFIQKMIGHECNAVFSNLGAFTGRENMEVYFSPPVGASTPLAIGCVSYNQQCFFTFRVHSALPFETEKELAEIFNIFKSKLLD